ncbi:MAG: ATP-binding protein [Vicinamibacterales bacterium]
MTIETFAHIVAHDLKAPLNGIASMIDFVVDDYADRLDADGQDQLRLIQAMATRGVAMVDGLRALTRVSTAEVRFRPLDLGPMAARAVADARVREPEATIEAAIATALPAAWGDPTLVPMVLQALVANAARFHRQPVRRIWIEPLAAPPPPIAEGFTAFAVRDDGIGIPERERAAVFDIFKRLHPVDAFGGGVGAGLAIAACVVARHGGRIWVESGEPGHTVVAFTLPAAPPAPEE